MSTATETTITLHFIPNAKGTPRNKLADVEFRYEGGKFDDLQQEGLISLWRRHDGGIYVKLPTRSFTVNGDKREYRLLRAQHDKRSVASFCDWLRTEYEKFAAGATTAA